MANSPIVARINALLAEKGIPKQTFYNACGITSASYSLWNTGKTQPRMKNLEIISNFLDVPVSYLLEGVGQKEKPTAESDELDKETIDKINAILELKGMTGAELEREIGVSNSVYSQWNTRITKPSKASLVKVASVLGVDVSELIADKKENISTTDKVKSICKERKIPISRLERELGYANGYIGQLRKGTFPDDRLVEIANYLGVSTSYLTGEDQKEKSPAPEGAELDPITKELFEIVNTSDEDELRALLEMARLIKKRRDA